MENDLKILVLSSLLHDIGKFAQRAKRPYSKNLENEYLTSYNGKKGHWHTLYTDYFIENDLKPVLELSASRSKIARIASAHHRPVENNLSEMCLMIADHLSSGAERIEYIEEESPLDFRESRLISIFDEIELNKHKFEAPGKYFHHLVPLSISADDDNIFPYFKQPEKNQYDYPKLFQEFLDSINQLNIDLDFSFYLDGLISILEKYTWCVPSSSYKTLPDVSLYDHAFSTAGIAQALYLYHKHHNSIPNEKETNEKFILLAGDLSGIQDYIFGISKNTGRGVSKILRARSFYLQALVKSVLIEIQNKLGLFSVCRLLESGGKFIMLIPNLESVKTELKKIDETVQFWFRDQFKGLLTLNMSWDTTLTQKDFLITQFQNKMDEVNHSLEKVKFRKLNKTFDQKSVYIETDYQKFEIEICDFCKRNAADEESKRRYTKEEGIEISICNDCCDQISYIGRELPNSDYLIYTKNGEIPLFSNICLTLSKEAPTSLKNTFHVETLKDEVNFSRVRLAKYLPRINSEELAVKNWFDIFNQEKEYGIIKENDIKTFSMIAHKSKKFQKDKDGKKFLTGRSLLGFFKADVDNMGLMLSLGLEEKLSVARFTCISRMLNLFFSEYLVKLAEKQFEDIYVVFAGGDDLFVVGPWNKTIEFAIELRKKLSQFCANNEDITMSAGIFIAKPRVPMRKAAELVEVLLEDAKQPEDKDSICIFDETISWKKLEELIKLGDYFDKCIEDEERTKFSTGFMYRLLTYHRMYRKFQTGTVSAGRYLSLAHYDIGRNIQKKEKDNQKEIDVLQNIFSTGFPKSPELEHLNIPLFYAINMNRE